MDMEITTSDLVLFVGEMELDIRFLIAFPIALLCVILLTWGAIRLWQYLKGQKGPSQ